MTTKQKAYIGLVLTSTIWGTTWVASKYGIKQGIFAFELSAIRNGLGGLALIVFFLLKGQKLPTFKEFKWLLGMSILLFVIANGFSTYALNEIPSGLAALIAALYPLSVVIIEKIKYKNTKITTLTFQGMLLGIIGIGIVFYENLAVHNSVGYFIGVVVSLIAMLSWSFGTIFIARNKMGMNPYYATGWQMFLSCFFLGAAAVASGKSTPIQEITFTIWIVIAYLIIASSIVAFAAFIYTMKYLPPAIASLYAYINPIVATIVGAYTVNEKLSLPIFIGSFVTLTGVYLVNRSMKKQHQEIIPVTDVDGM
jgi:drug/metabolite transporter (DMT)-like permease